MAASSDAAATAVVFSADGVREFIRGNNGKVSNSQLARHYRSYLLDPERHETNKALFKQFISAVGSIRREGNEKYVILKSEPLRKELPTVFDTPRQLPVAANRHGRPFQTPSNSSTEFEMSNERKSGEIPVAPPRRRHDENKLILSREPSEDASEPQNLSNTDENISVASNVSVKEHAKKLNKMASESQLVLRPSENVGRKQKNNDKFDDNDYVDSSTVALDAHTKEWIVKAAGADFDALARLLKEDARLVRYKDFTSATHQLVFEGEFQRSVVHENP